MQNQVEEAKLDSARALDDPALIINRETSWLAFNARVLGEAESSHNPLLERLKFVAIHAANLDEFFMIRVSGLHEQLEAAVVEVSPDGLTPREQLTRIRSLLLEQLEGARRVVDELLRALAPHGIEIVDWAKLDGETRARANQYFRTTVFPILTPLAVDPGHPFPFLSNLSLSLAVEVRDPASQERKFARVKVPEGLPRFVPLDEPDRRGSPLRFVPLEQLIEENLSQLFPELEILGAYPFRVTRDMDFEVLAEEAIDLMSIIDRELRKRRFGACVRLEIDRDIPGHIRRMLLEKLEIDEDDLYETSGLLGFSALMAIATVDRPELRDAPLLSRLPVTLADGEGATSIFRAIRSRDVLLHHPYDSFAPVLEFLNEAAVDPHVLAVKMTLYRGGSNADAARALIRAAEHKKQVAVSIELKARFDEENNITWARAMERAGAHVFFGGAVTKTHCKVALVVRREGDTIRRYVHLSTGNYNASTARLYTDMGFFTTDPEIGEDVSELFNALSGFSKQTHYRKLAVAPAGLIDAVLGHIEHEEAMARAGKPARIFAKMNSLVDLRVCTALYRASMAGVSIELVVRGVCALRPGLPGISENIRVRSLMGRFLEHPRVFVFGVEGRESFFLSSADWMPRNFYDRVEVLFPIESERLREQIRREVVEPALRSDIRAHELAADGSYRRLPEDGQGLCAQQLTLEHVANDPGRRGATHGRSQAAPVSARPPT